MNPWNLTPQQREEYIHARYGAAERAKNPGLEIYPAEEVASNDDASGAQISELQDNFRRAFGSEEEPTQVRGNAWGGVKPYRIEVKPTPAPGMPGGRTWSIKQIMEGK